VPKAPIARSATAPVISSSLGAIAPGLRPSLSSFKASAGMPRTSPAAQVRAQSWTRTSGVGEVSRLQIIAPAACPTLSVATSRIGTSSSMTCPMPIRVQKEYTTGREPSILICRSGASA
jgi:hypothetical protein